MREKHQLFFGLRLVSKEFQHPAIHTKIEQHFGGFFYQIKVRQPIGRQNSMQRNKQEVGLIFAWSGSELWYSRVKIKQLKTYSCWCLFQGLSNAMEPLSCRSNVDGTFKYIKYFHFVCSNLQLGCGIYTVQQRESPELIVTIAINFRTSSKPVFWPWEYQENEAYTRTWSDLHTMHNGIFVAS